MLQFVNTFNIYNSLTEIIYKSSIFGDLDTCYCSLFSLYPDDNCIEIEMGITT